MNRKRLSFLFFIIHGLLLLPLSTSMLPAQTKLDSIDHTLNNIYTSADKLQLVKGVRYLEKTEGFIEEELPLYYKLYVYETMANTYYSLGDLDESEVYAVKGLSLIKSDYNSIRTRFICLLGMLQKERGFYELAHEKYVKALALSNTANDSLTILNNLANLFKEQKHFDNAIASYQLGLALVPRLQQDSLHQKTKLLDNLGNTLSISSGTGLEELFQALQLSRLLSNKIRSYSVNRHLTQHYLRKADTTAALQYAPIVYELSKEIGDRDYEKEALSLLLKLNQQQYGLRYVQLSDSLNLARQKADNAYALLKYDKSEAEKKALEAEISRQRILIIGIILVFITVVSAIVIITTAQRKRRRAISETEQRIAKHVHDDIANNVFLVMNKLDNTKNQKIMDDLSMIYDQARLISRSNSSFNTEQPFQQALLDMFQQYSKKNFKITPQNISTISWNKISTKKKEALYKVLQELLTNTLKHSTATFVVVSFEQEKSSLQIAYRDNGKGSSSKPSGGLLIVENRIRAVSGTITFTSSPNNGFKAKIKV
ncbi:hypothetical protein MG296_11130 [Flavobacteriaceae bacterium TK19130]|nr:hypothetical protein [Thermobacterium salinum]